MNLTAITVRKENTRVANVTIKKDTIQINELFKANSIYTHLLYNNAAAVAGLLQEITKPQKANVIFSVPGSLVRICCAENTIAKRKFANEEQRKKTEQDWLSELFMITEPDQYYFSTFTSQKGGKYFTALSIFKNHVDTIIESCAIAGIDVSNLSIEPEVLSVLRFINDWENACCFLEIEDDSAKMTGYDPVKGMIDLSLPEASLNNLNGSNGTENFSVALAMYEITADNIFGYKDADTFPPIYLISEYDSKLYGLLSVGEHSFRFKNFKIPQYFQTGGFGASELIKYASTLGLAYRPLFLRDIANKHAKGGAGR